MLNLFKSWLVPSEPETKDCPMEHTFTSEIESAETVREVTKKAIKQTKIPKEYKEAALAFIETYMKNNPVATSTELLSKWRESGCEIAQRDSRNIWGSCISSARASGIMRKAGRVKNLHAHSHNLTTTQWVSTTYPDADKFITAEASLEYRIVMPSKDLPVTTPEEEHQQRLLTLLEETREGRMPVDDALIRAYTLGTLVA